MATQKNSPVFVAQALEKVLEILKNSELYSPEFDKFPTQTNDQMTSDLISGLISVSNFLKIIRNFWYIFI